MNDLLERARKLAEEASDPILNRGDHDTCRMVGELAKLLLRACERLESLEYQIRGE